jgi:hypothetical protein
MRIVQKHHSIRTNKTFAGDERSTSLFTEQNQTSAMQGERTIALHFTIKVSIGPSPDLTKRIP